MERRDRSYHYLRLDNRAVDRSTEFHGREDLHFRHDALEAAVGDQLLRRTGRQFRSRVDDRLQLRSRRRERTGQLVSVTTRRRQAMII